MSRPTRAGLPSIEELAKWIDEFVGCGIPQLPGGPNHKAYLAFLEARLSEMGFEVVRETQPCQYREIRGFSLEALSDAANRTVPVLQCSRSSEATPPGGVVGELMHFGPQSDLGRPDDRDIAGKIVLVDIEGTASYAEISNGFTTHIGGSATVSESQSWSDLVVYSHKLSSDRFPLDDRPGLTSLFKGIAQLDLSPLAARGALGAIAVMHEGTARGMQGVAPPFTGLPVLVVDGDTGMSLREAASTCAQVRLTVDATVEPSSSDQLFALLPGVSDEIVMVHTHTDGVSAFQENGGIGVLAIARHLASLSPEERGATFAFVFPTGHMVHDVQSTDFFLTAHAADLVPRIRAAVAVEHLGATEWCYDNDGHYGPSGRPEPSMLFVSPAAKWLVQETIAVVQEEDLEEAYVLEPMGGGKIILGEGVYPHLFGIPTVQHMAAPDYLLSHAPDGFVNRLDIERMAKTIEVMTSIACRLGRGLSTGAWVDAQQPR